MKLPLPRTSHGWRLMLAALLSACVSYDPVPFDQIPFRERGVTETQAGVTVTAAALGREESARAFDVPLGSMGIQPVWLQIRNDDRVVYGFYQHSVDPDYWAPAEAAYKSRFSSSGRLLSYGVVGLLFPPLWLAMPFQYVSAQNANARMEAHFMESAIGNRLLLPGEAAEGFVFTNLDEGTKRVSLQLLHPEQSKKFDLFVQVPGVRADHHQLELERLYAEDAYRDVDLDRLRQELFALPCCTTNRSGDGEGDLLNLVLVGDLEDLVHAFTRGGWDETEIIDVGTSLKTAVSFVFGSSYRYSPVSDLYLFGRSQDVAFQRARDTIHQRNHLRLWLLPLRYEGKHVWVGAVSRDIGVKFTTRTWNLTTHAIDADLDDARDAAVGDLLESGRVMLLSYIAGPYPSPPGNARKNLMGDLMYADGYFALVALGNGAVETRILGWQEVEGSEHHPLP